VNLPGDRAICTDAGRSPRSAAQYARSVAAVLFDQQAGGSRESPLPHAVVPGVVAREREYRRGERVHVFRSDHDAAVADHFRQHRRLPRSPTFERFNCLI
jgi:hypothetical protein